MKIIIYSFRNEYHLSGQYKATSHMMELFTELGHEVEAPRMDVSSLHKAHQLNLKLLALNIDRLVNGCDFLNQSDADLIIIRIPCLSQLVLLSLFYRKLKKPVVVILESMAWSGRNLGNFFREFKNEPILSTSKRIINHPAWGKLLSSSPKINSFICSSKAQIDQAKKIIGNSKEFHHIENSIMDNLKKPQPRKPFNKDRLVLGYIGHGVAYKGSIEVTEAAKILRATFQKVELKGAFSGVMGFNHVHKNWLACGGEMLGQVTLSDFFNTIDILCYPLYEDYGTQVHSHVILEAMQHGAPLIVSKTPAILELLEPERIPMLDRVTGRDVANAILETLERDPNEISQYLRSRFQKIAKSVVKKKWEGFLEGIESQLNLKPFSTSRK